MSWHNDYVGIQFAEKGRGKGNPVDCWGLVQLVYAERLGIALPDYLEDYETTDDRDTIGEHIGNVIRENWHEPAAPEPFDVIILRLRGVPMHVGLVTRPGYMLHCARGVGAVHESYNSSKWRSNVMGFARHGTPGSLRSPAAVQR